MSKQVERNGEIEILRFVFSMIILCHHFNTFTKFSIFYNGYIGVEFFFVVSGFLMAKSSKKDANGNKNLIPDMTWTFIKRKLSGFYSYFIIAIFIQFVFVIIIEKPGVIQAIKYLVANIPSSLLVEMGGLRVPNNILYVGGSWYLSVMMLSVLILYPILLFNYEWSSKIFFPIFGLFGLGIIYTKYATIVLNFESITNMFLGGMLRGLSEMALAVWGYEIAQKIKAYNLTKLSVILLTIVKYISLIIIILFAGSTANSCYTIAAFICCLVVVILSFSEKTINISYNTVTKFLGKISLPIYLTHCIFRRISERFIGIDAEVWKISIMIVACIVFSCVVMAITDFITKYLKNIKLFFVDCEK